MKRWTIVAGAVVTLSVAATPAEAQRGWQEVECELSTSHYLVNSAQLYLKNASTTRFADQRERDLRDARRVIFQALDQGRQGDPAVWYFLGRWYKVQDDPAGMDTAFARAQALAPSCAADIAQHRRQVWVPMLNRGVQALQNGSPDEAKRAFQQANEVYDAEPSAYYYLAQLYAQEGTTDSAVANYAVALRIASDTANADDERFQEIRERSLFNVARLYHRDEAWDSAAVWYQRYLEIAPNDAQALTGLASVLNSGGRGDEAIAIYDTVLARADSLPPLDLLQAGIALFNADRYERAARAFETALARSQYFRQRETLFNLANTYLSIGNADTTRADEMAGKMAPVLQRLLTIDPASIAVKRLQAAVYQLRDEQDSTLAVLEQAQSQPFDVTVSTFAPAGQGLWDMRGIITNNQESGAVSVPELVFEFLDAEGNVVTTATVAAQSLDEGGLAPIRIAPRGETIVGWRYSVADAS